MFSTEKKFVVVGTIGHVDHGKTTLTSAILAVQNCKGLSTFKSYEEISKGGKIRSKGKILTVISSHVCYETKDRFYSHIDCPGHEDYIKNMITGASQMDGAILIVSAVDGPMAQTREHIILAKQLNIPAVIVFINKCDLADEEIVDVVELEVRELLSKYGYDGENVPVIRGSAKLALEHPSDNFHSRCIDELLDSLDNYIAIPDRLIEKPLFFPIDAVYHIHGRGTVVTGKLEYGKIKVGDKIDVLGFGKRINTVCIGLEIYNTPISYAKAGDNVGILLRNIKRSDLSRGYVVCQPGSVEQYSCFEACIYLLNHQDGGRQTPVFDAYTPQFYFKTTDVTGTVILKNDVDFLIPGETGQVSVLLRKPIPINIGSKFTIREGGKTVGSGFVTNLGGKYDKYSFV